MVKENKKASLERQKRINQANQPRPSKSQDSAKVHNTKGKNNHGRTFK